MIFVEQNVWRKTHGKENSILLRDLAFSIKITSIETFVLKFKGMKFDI